MVGIHCGNGNRPLPSRRRNIRCWLGILSATPAMITQHGSHGRDSQSFRWLCHKLCVSPAPPSDPVRLGRCPSAGNLTHTGIVCRRPLVTDNLQRRRGDFAATSASSHACRFWCVQYRINRIIRWRLFQRASAHQNQGQAGDCVVVISHRRRFILLSDDGYARPVCTFSAN